MNRIDIAAKLKSIIDDHLGLEADECTEESMLKDDLGADSLDWVELTMAVEEEFGIELPDDEMTGITRVSHIIDLVDRKVNRDITRT